MSREEEEEVFHTYTIQPHRHDSDTGLHPAWFKILFEQSIVARRVVCVGAECKVTGKLEK